MTESITRCNGCRKVKGESNHWIGIRPLGSRQTIMPRIEVLGFEDSTSADEHYCGPACAVKRFAEFLDQLREESIQFELDNNTEDFHATTKD